MKLLKKLLKKIIIWIEIRKIKKKNKLNKNTIINKKGVKNNSVKTVKKLKSLKVNKKKKSIVNYLFYAPIAVFSLIFLLSIGKIIIWSIEKISVDKTMDDINNMVVIEEVVDNKEETLPEEEKKEEVKKEESIYDTYKKINLINVDFNKLKELNSATVGWIQVNGTEVNYPIVRALDNEFYLHRDFNDNYNSAGWIFMDYRNDPNNLDKNTIIYGHNRMDNIMFGTLMNTLKKSWFNNKDNHYVKLSTPTENSVWQVFSVYYIKATSDYIQTEFINDSDYLDFINLIKGRSVHNFNLDVSSNDKIITLSSCYSKTERLVVHAKLVNSQAR